MIFLILGIACLLTCIIEACMLFGMHYQAKKWILASLVCNLLTNISLNLIYPAVDYLFTMTLPELGIFSFALGHFFGYCVLVLMEVGVVFLEAWIYGFFVTDAPFRERLSTSAKVNATSFILGLIVTSATLCACRLPYYA